MTTADNNRALQETVRIDLPTLHPAQAEIAMSPARYKVIRAGRRTGKGVLGVGTGFRLGMHDKKVWWVTPSFTTPGYHAAWRLATEWASRIPGTKVSQINKTIFFPGFKEGRGFFQFKSASVQEGGTLRGEGIDLVIVDEAAHIKRLLEMWEQELSWSLMDRGGGAWFISTPRGYNGFHALHKRCGLSYAHNKAVERIKDGDINWATFHYPSDANPFLNPADIADLTKSMPGMVVRQERFAEFVQLSGVLFRREWFDGEGARAIVDTELCEARARSWDLAWTTKTNSDQTAGSKGGMTSDGDLFINHVLFGKWEWPDAVGIISSTAMSDGPDVEQGIEVVGAQRGMLQTLLRDPRLANIGFRAIEVHHDKLTRALPLIARAEQEKFKLLRAPWNVPVVNQLCGFSGNDDDEDDIVDSLTGLLHMIATPGGDNSSRVRADESGSREGGGGRSVEEWNGRTDGGRGEGGGRTVVL